MCSKTKIVKTYVTASSNGGVVQVSADEYNLLRSKNLSLLSKSRMVRNAIEAGVAATKTFAKKVTGEEREIRIAICGGCARLNENRRCSICGCFVNFKSTLEAWHCPIGKW